ncbi:MAG: putative porin [Candidatus Omnitrophica bacterium]|nr:putative porin [Candidatus Omnitrophota bacterium]
MRKFLTAIVLIGIISLGLGMHFSYASEVDALLQKLIDKGVLNASEAQEIRTQTNEQITKADKQKEEDYKKLAKDNMPDWVKNTKLKGDFRLRYEWDKDKGSQDNSRARIRARLGIESQVNNKLKMAVGIATGATNDPRSRNITLGSDANTTNTPGSPKSIVLDYAYAQYTPFNGLALSGGKIQNPLWRPWDVFWKGDITPDGAGVNYSYKLNPKVDIFMNDLVYVMKNDTRTDKQVALAVFQPGVNIAVNNKTNLKTAVAYNQFFNVKGANAFSNAGSRTNSGVSGSGSSATGQYRYNYNSIQPTAELSFKQPFSGLLPYAAIFGEYMYNVSLPSDATGAGGYQAGIKFGTENITDWGQWRTQLVYSKLGRDCWLDIFTDSDRYGGKTNSKAYEAVFSYGLAKNTWLDLDYYYAESLTQSATTGRTPEHVLQVDWNMKF